VQPHDLAETDGAARAAAVLLHPHPDMGGDRFNNVVSALYQALPSAGVTALRFDFSSSSVDIAVRESIEALDRLPDDVPRVVAGYSFGGAVAAAINDERVAGWFLAAPALSSVEPAIGRDPRPKLVVAAEHDQFFPPARLEAATADWDAAEVITVPGADHFFAGRSDAVAELCVGWITRVAQ